MVKPKKAKECGILGIGLNYTSECNAFCAHCVASAEPQRKQKFNPFKLKKYFKGIHRFNSLNDSFKVREVNFTGGEPLLFFDEVLGLMAEAKRLGIESSIVTNGFWANNLKETERKISLLEANGLKNINLSMDVFHSQFINEKNYSNIFKAFEKPRKLRLTVRLLRLPGFGYLKEMNRVAGLKRRPFVGVQNLLPFGRAANLGEKYLLHEEFGPKTRCPLVKQPFMDSNGALFLCCNGILKKNNFFLGNYKEKPLEKTLKVLAGNPLRRAMHFYGPVRLVEGMWKTFSLSKKSRAGYSSICHYCLENLSSFSKEEVNGFLKGKGFT